MRKPRSAKPVRWTRDKLVHLFINGYYKTNSQLSEDIGVALTSTRNKLREFGIQKEEKRTWTKEQTSFLKRLYKTKGNVEIAKMFAEKWPREGGWNRGHIHKKLSIEKWKRTEEERNILIADSSRKGGARYTIDKNSSSINMHPSWLVRLYSRDMDKEARRELAKDKELVANIKATVLLKRKIKNASKENKLDKRTD